MKEIKLESGLVLSVDERVMDDMELLDALSDLNEEDGTAISRICRILLGKEEKAKLYEHLRKDGKVRVSDVVHAIMEIFRLLGEQGKN